MKRKHYLPTKPRSSKTINFIITDNFVKNIRLECMLLYVRKWSKYTCMMCVHIFL